ncbi:MAG: hypothetical protein ACXVDF_17580 [Ktedonobacterales bacterium]
MLPSSFLACYIRIPRCVVEGLREAVLAVVYERFGMLPSALEQRVAGADAAMLREVLVHAVTETLDQVSERLR